VAVDGFETLGFESNCTPILGSHGLWVLGGLPPIVVRHLCSEAHSRNGFCAAPVDRWSPGETLEGSNRSSTKRYSGWVWTN